MLAAIGRHFGWSRAELEALSGVEMRFWIGAINQFHERVKGNP
jgi:hypothetical protein